MRLAIIRKGFMKKVGLERDHNISWMLYIKQIIHAGYSGFISQVSRNGAPSLVFCAFVDTILP